MYFFFAVFSVNTSTHHKILSKFFPSIQTKYLGGKLHPASLKYLLYYLYVWTQQKQEKTNVINKHQLKTFDNVTLLYQFLFQVNKHRQYSHFIDTFRNDMKSEITVNELRPNCLQIVFKDLKGYFPSLVYFFNNFSVWHYT